MSHDFWYNPFCVCLCARCAQFKGLVRMRFIESDENLTLRGAALQEAIKDDIKLGLVPFWVREINLTLFCLFIQKNTLALSAIYK